MHPYQHYYTTRLKLEQFELNGTKLNNNNNNDDDDDDDDDNDNDNDNNNNSNNNNNNNNNNIYWSQRPPAQSTICQS